MQTLLQDVRYGIRMLVKNPASTLVAIVALTLGIGANSAIFSVIDAVLLRPLSYPEPDRLVALWETKADKGIQRENVSPPNFKDWVEENRVFDRIGAIRPQPGVLTGGDFPERIETALVSPSVLDMLGVRTLLGRAFAAGEEQPGRNRVAMIGDGLWKRRFGSARDVLGKTLIVDGVPYNIIGVAPPDFALPPLTPQGLTPEPPAELWIPYALDSKELSQRGFRTLKVIAHLKSGTTVDQARSEMRSIGRHLEEQYKDINEGWSVVATPLLDEYVGDIRPTLWILGGAVCFVLLIACANVANLLLARAGGREKEISVRAAVGANSWRLIRQLLTESVLLSLVSGLFGVFLAYASIALLVKLGPADLPRSREISIDARVLVFTLLVAMFTGVVFGLAPALYSVRSGLNSILKTSGRGTSASRGRGRVRDALVVAEIASCVVLLIGAGLLLRSFARLQQVNPGFRPDHLLTMQLALPETRYSGIKVALFYQQLLDRVRTLPGVNGAALARNLPLSGADASLNFVVESWPAASSSDQPRAKYRAVSDDYFEALGIPLIHGRYFNRGDAEKTPGAVILNAAMVRRYWPSGNPIGSRMKDGFDGSQWCTIVGIVGDVKHRGLEADANPEMYYDYLQVNPALMNFVEGVMTLVVRTNADPSSMTASIRNEVLSLDPSQPVFNVKTMDQLVESSVAQPRFRTLLLGIFAAVALALAAIGLYGVISYSVTQRTNELGVRSALGASRGDLLSLVVGQGAKMATAGIGIGLVAAFGLTRLLSRLLFGVTATDPLTFAATVGAILCIALIASYIPALRAAKTDPVVALRYE